MIKPIFLMLALSACNFEHGDKYEKPSKEQNECLVNYHALQKQSFKEDLNLFKESMNFKDDDSIINYELYQRREKERLCMIKASCYDRLKGVEFSDCINDIIPEQ